VNPCIPAVWPHYSLECRVGRTHYRFTVSNPEHRCCGVGSAELDGVPVDAGAIPVEDDGEVHDVTIVLGADAGLGMHAAIDRRAKHRGRST
jgi:cyclic beta-1,2-glucan synthetase